MNALQNWKDRNRKVWRVDVLWRGCKDTTTVLNRVTRKEAKEAAYRLRYSDYDVIVAFVRRNAR